MKFSSTLYPYQIEILEIFEKEQARGDKKIHIVAPPGSGKTIVGLEMMCRIDAPTLILVPNLTLQEQWKDKLERMFLETHEKSEDLISTSILEIKKINIVTYQSLSGSDKIEDDSINAKILDIWFLSEKDEFNDKNTFLLFVEELKVENPDEYRELYTKHRKKLKESGESESTRKLIKWTIHEYVEKLRSAWVQAMIVDEAHHLTAWWSHVLYMIWTDLGSPYIIGLTATPPFESVDYFELDESYTKLLWTVDYYVPTPAIVKSGRLAPYSDLLYIVAPDTWLADILWAKEKALQDFIEIHKDAICVFLHGFLVENFSRLEVKSLDLLEKWMRFVYVYKSEWIDMSSYITANASKPINLEDIAKSIGKWGADGFKKTKTNTLLDEIKPLFFDLGYIWRGANLYRFQTPIEKWLIYSKSKILWAQDILKKEIENMGDSLRVAIITDFLDVESDWINGHFIFDELAKSHADLNPYLVSGQWIWKLENGIKTETNETILSVTEKLTRWETKLVIGTRGILGEWWDCPAVNTLIDLTGVSAYMSVNQVHGRAIRLDKENPEKVANIYDIVCLGHGYQWMRDFERLEKKHTQFYWVDDSGLIIKELDHIYPQLERMISNPEKINNYTLRKSNLRAMVRELWGIGGEYKNEEIFSLSIEILKPYEVVPIPSKFSWWQIMKIKPEKWKDENILELGKSSYHRLVRAWIKEVLDASLQVMKPHNLIPHDFYYEMKHSDTWSITISSQYKDPLISKKFIETVVSMFGPITEEKYALNYSNWHKGPEILDKKLLDKKIHERISSILILLGLLFSILSIPLAFWSENPLWLLTIPTIGLTSTLIRIKWITVLLYPGIEWFINFKRKFSINKFNQYWVNETTVGLPDIIVSNEEKRRWFIWKEYGAIPEEAQWYNWCFNWIQKCRNTIKLIFYPYNFFYKLIWIIDPINWKQITWDNWILKWIINGIRNIIFSILLGLLIIFIWFPSLLLYLIFILHTLLLFLSFFTLHLPYKIFAKIYNFEKRKRTINPAWSIEPTTQSDIGKPSFLSAKIEKLWI